MLDTIMEDAAQQLQERSNSIVTKIGAICAFTFRVGIESVLFIVDRSFKFMTQRAAKIFKEPHLSPEELYVKRLRERFYFYP